ncbi:MAG: zinc ribbon domain-containing protein [Candidatus Absconditabacteria bacterium]|nr:zinc ribbon domain-containing protein [Candidatus Absconditabacteria bacterium]MDD3868499.1 zinc ribbon domain-containing protein [Candidatus Absconditabacteria bacterium]MDD4713905.1 zinc ribbon domain-containing protein [Candidatus Absconditabacteria bacterium]
MEQIFCQSCGMPVKSEFTSTNQDGTVNTTYCCYCYKDGQFTSDVTMDQMIEHCIQYLDEYNGASGTQFTKEKALSQMKQYFPTLGRWKQ